MVHTQFGASRLSSAVNVSTLDHNYIVFFFFTSSGLELLN